MALSDVRPASLEGETGVLRRNTSGFDEVKDVEKGIVAADATEVGMVRSGEELQRSMKARHVAMISLGGAIGTGIFLGTANALRMGGPLGILLGYSIMGTIVYSVMVALGEVAAQLPLPGGCVTMAARFVDKPFGFCVGYWYLYDWLLAMPAELSASAVLISFWDNHTSPAVWIAVTGFVAVLINFGGSRVYGETEFWFASIKMVTILGLIILGIVLTAGGGPSGEVIGGKYWQNPGPLVQYLGIEGAKGRFLGFFTVLLQSAYSYIGSEIVAIAAAEAKNPKKTVPSAIKKVWVRIVLFYVCSVTVIGLLVSSADPRLNLSDGTAASSPFVIAVKDAGIKALPSIVNAAILTSAWSAASSDVYTSSRCLHGLALQGNAPRVFARTNSWGVPVPAIGVAVLFALLAFMSAGAGRAGEVFGWFANMTSVCGLLVWGSILIVYLRFYWGAKAQGLDRREFAYRAPFQPYLSYYALGMIVIVLIFSKYTVFLKGHWNTADFITSYLPIALFPLTYVTVYVWKRYIRKLPRSEWARTPLADLDFVSGSRAGDDDDEPEPKTKVGKVLNAFL
ncbi:hypothetical protein NBRC10513v2_001015 [Rhodotorula toruloides]|uniref:Amino acid transporter n=1 Tax=Rhodotorula toruloides TaxID=5286 RepID=A0A2T0AHL5_RHOTO|nr:amino acid transporter [Rhodotorula toruloides]